MIVLIVLLIAGIVFWAIVEGTLMLEEGTPAKDCDILEMLENYGTDFSIEKKWNDEFKLHAGWKSLAPNINQTQYSIIFPYYIDGVGAVPIWYKSASIIKKMFEEKISASKYKVTKRDKLGLN